MVDGAWQNGKLAEAPSDRSDLSDLDPSVHDSIPHGHFSPGTVGSNGGEFDIKCHKMLSAWSEHRSFDRWPRPAA